MFQLPVDVDTVIGSLVTQEFGKTQIRQAAASWPTLLGFNTFETRSLAQTQEDFCDREPI